MHMSILINKFKIIRYFIKNGILNEERAIEISKFDHNTIEALVHSQLLVQVDGRVYLDKPLYDFRYKEKYIYYGEIILLIIFLIFAFHVSYLKTTLFWREWYEKNRIQRLQEDMNEDLQKYLDEDLLDTTPKEKKESTFWMKCVALCLLCSYGIAQFLGRVLGDKQAIVQYGLGRVEAKGWLGEEMGLIGFKAKYMEEV